MGYSKCDNIVYYEYKLFRDILLLNIKNHYFNITNAFLEALSWINWRCNYDFLIKWDDDIMVNIPLLLIYSNLKKQLLRYSGYTYNNTKICREKSKICFIPYNIYHYSYLPSFAASGLLILSRETSMKIYYYHRSYKLYMIRDDQYIGILCKKLSIKPELLNNYYFRKNRNKGNFTIKYLIAYHSNNNIALNNMYNSIEQ